jgi:uncharacterized protein
MLEAIWNVVLALGPWLLFGTLVAALLHGLVPSQFIKRQLKGVGGVYKAVALGVPLPLCSCGVIPAGLGLKRDGASDGAAIGFLISTPQTGVDSIMVSAAFLGWPFALFKVASATVTGIAGGMLAHLWGEKGGAPESEGQAATAPSAAFSGNRLRSMFDHGIQIIRSIWYWLVFGIVVSAAITNYVPTETLAGLASYGGVFALLAVLGISLPLYVCATASVPIAAALVAGGMPTGAALVFLMAGPATNLATMGAIHRGFGGRILAIYLITIIGGSIGFGLTFDSLLSASGGQAIMHDHGHANWLELSTSVVFLALLAYFALEWARNQIRRITMNDKAGSEASITLSVGGMSCGGCVNKLEGALRNTDGVETVTVTLKPGAATIQGALDEAQFRKVIEENGFTVGS